MPRCFVILTLLLTQLFAPALASAQAVLCVHADGSAVVESVQQWQECHTGITEIDRSSVSAPACRDIPISGISIQQSIGARDSSHILQLWHAHAVSVGEVPSPPPPWR